MGCFRRRGYSTIENRNISSLTKNLVKTHHLHKAIKIDVLFTAHARQTAKRRRGLEKQGLTLSCFEREEATNNKTHHWYFLPSRHAWNRQATLTHTARRCSRLVLQPRRGFFYICDCCWHHYVLDMTPHFQSKRCASIFKWFRNIFLISVGIWIESFAGNTISTAFMA